MLADIAAAVRVPPGGVLVEIGAGTGQLTEVLLGLGADVVALEIEERLVRHLRQRFASERRLRVVQGDARDIDLASILPPGVPFSVAGNLPYFAANPIIRKLLEGTRQPTELVVMVQREVARELAAKSGRASLLTVSVQVYAEAEILFEVRPEAFDPPPAVWSSVVRLTVRPAPLVPAVRNAAFFTLVARTFRNPRKQLRNGLSQGMWLPKGGAEEVLHAARIDATRRPETLSVADWLSLLDACEALLVGG